MKVSIGSDHAGFEMKEYLKYVLNNLNVDIIDKGTYSTESTDYPDFAHAVANSVVQGDVNFGILICGSANGVAMAANKHAEIRCAVCWTEEVAILARAHNDANILAVPARFVSQELADNMVTKFLKTEFEGGRHKRRVDKIATA